MSGTTHQSSEIRTKKDPLILSIKKTSATITEIVWRVEVILQLVEE